ncbi:MAG: hypothetical protein AAF488_04515 [Planctomycetota bacterium]
MTSSRRRGAPSVWMAPLVWIALCTLHVLPISAQESCLLTTTAEGGGVIEAVGGVGYDPELAIEIGPNNSFVRLENQELKIIFEPLVGFRTEFPIRHAIIKSVGQDQLFDVPTDYFGAGAGIGNISSATLVYDGDDKKTIRLEWNQWDVLNQVEKPQNKIIRDYTIYPFSRHVKVDFVDIEYAVNITDLGRPGGTFGGDHVVHGADVWIRGLTTHDESPGLYYSRYAPDGVNDPADGGSLSYNGNFIMGVYSPTNGRGFARVMPVADTHIVKLLLSQNTRRGVEYQNYPFLNPHDPFTGYLYVVTGGEDEMLATGRALVDQTDVACGDVTDVSAHPYSGWVFSHWSGDLNSITNPEFIALEGDQSVTGHFSMAPADLSENFDTYAADENPLGWEDTAAGNSLTIEDSLFTVADDGVNTYLQTTDEGTNIHSHVVGVDLGVEGYETTGKFRITDPEGGIGVTVLSQYPSSHEYYRLRRFYSNGFHLTANGTSFTSGTTETGVVPNVNTWYRFRVRVEVTETETTVRAMVWLDGDLEPLAWQAEAVDASANRLVGGTVGVWSFHDGAKQWDDLAARTYAPPRTDISLTTSVIGNGSVSTSPDQPLYSFGTGVELTATADAGWLFDRWSGDIHSTLNPITINMLDDRSVTAEFVPITQHTLTLTSDGNGLIQPSPQQATYDLGSDVTLFAIPDENHVFAGWGGDASGAGNPTIITIGGDSTVTATFVPSEVAYAEDFNTLANGADPLGWVDTGANNSLAPVDHFDVQNEAGNGIFQTTSNATNIHTHLTGVELPVGGYRFSGRLRLEQAGGGVGITVFSQYPGASDYYRLRRYDDNSFHLSPVGASLAGDTETGFVPTAGEWTRFIVEVVDEGTATRVRAKVWTDGESEPGNWQADAIDSNPTRLTEGTVGLWTFRSGQKAFDDLEVAPIGGVAPAPPTFHPVTAGTSGDGTVVVAPDQDLYESGSIVTLEAFPAAGWLFDGWSGGVVGIENPLDVQIAGDLNVTAVFIPITEHTVDVTVDGNGTASVDPNVALHELGSVVTLTATPDAGWIFAGWSGDASGNSNPLDVAVTGDLLVTATFVEPAENNLEDFQSYAGGDDPAGWNDTGRNNSLATDDGLFKVFADGGQRWFGTTSNWTNIHSHQTEWILPVGGYQVSGRMRITSDQAGIGVTFFSQFPNQASYYRLRRYQGNDFHISPFGTSITGGESSSGVIPAPNSWYRFRIEVEDAGTQTNIRARVWLDGTVEPSAWSIDCFDSSNSRLTAGSVGLWSFNKGHKHWDDIAVDPLGPPPPPPTDLVLDIASAGSGFVTVDPDLAEYHYGDEVEVTAVADPGWVFTGFTGDITSAENPLLVTMVQDVSITANFVEIGGDYFEDFNTYVLGENPANWYDTQPNNSLASGNAFYVGTFPGSTHFEVSVTDTNLHSHYVGGLPDPRAYEYTGRMRITKDSGGIGVTFFSQFPSEAKYYRLRRYMDNSFHISPAGTSITGGVTDTGVIPVDDVWYSFRIQVEDTGTETAIRANVWVHGDPEPSSWQVDCFDSSPSRLTSGTVGVWSFWQGTKQWDDLGVEALAP